MEPMSLALEGRFLTTEPLGKSLKFCVNLILSSYIRFLKEITVDSQTAVIKYE